MNALRRAGLACAAVLAIAAPSAHAEGAIHAQCTVHFSSGGSGTGTCAVTGEANGMVLVSAPMSMQFTYTAGVCGLSGSASGTMSGAVDNTFAWTWFGVTGVIVTNGDIDGGGETQSLSHTVGCPAPPSSSTVLMQIAGV